MAVRYRCFVGIAAVALAACGSTAPLSPTPPPGMALEPKAQVVDALDSSARSKWPAIAPRVRSLVLASSATRLVALVEYASSNTVVDPYKDNFRYVIDGDGVCQVEATKIPVRAGDLVVAPMGIARGCAAKRKTLTLLTVSFARGQSRVGVYLQPPPAGRIDAEKQMHSLPVASSAWVTKGLYEGYYGEILAAKAGVMDGPLNGSDEFIYIQNGDGELLLDGRRSRLAAGTIFVAPANKRFTIRAVGKPLEALIVRSYRQVSEI